MERRKEQVRDADDVIRDYYESDTEGAFRADGTEPVSRVREQGADQSRLGELAGGDPDAADPGGVGEETPTGSNPTPDHDIVDDIGRAAGIEYQDNEPLKFGEKMAERDVDRWELNPASSEDYETRSSSMTEPPPSIPSPDAEKPPHQAGSSSSPRPPRQRKARTRRTST